MAELAHDAPGPASSEPAGTPQQASGPATSDKGKLRVFISYSRDDQKFADQLDEALNAYGFECLIDRHGISGGEDWKRRLGNLISEADTVVFVLSPSSARSEICTWEVEEATRLNKRILPVICRPLEGVSPPPRLQDLNYMFFYEEPKVSGSGFGNGLAKLVTALNTDFDWLREHTRYLQRAIEWDKGGRPANRLLSGNDILDAKAWAARRPKGAPEPTALQLDFIRGSEEEAEARSSAQRKQLEAVAAAQAEREKALHEAEEALKQAADAQRRRARSRNIALVVIGILVVVAGWFSLNAFYEKFKAEEIMIRAGNIFLDLGERTDAKTQQKAAALFQASAAKDDAQAMANLGALYENGDGVPQDYDKARELYEKAAAKDNAVATYLGVLYENGHGVPQDYDKARALYEIAAAKDDAVATYLGVLYENGHGVPQDYDKARELYEKAAAKDDAVATYLGVLYENGHGVPQDYDKARELYEKAAAKDNAVAMRALGVLYMNGQGVAQDYDKARELYEKAAAKDDAGAMTNLGFLYTNGQGVAQDYDKARELYEKAAAKDDAVAMRNLGVLYHYGYGVPQDYAKARELYEKAAAKDDAGAMANLGVLYTNGQGVAQDYDKAREWLEKAADKGDPSAKMALELLTIHEATTAGRYDEALRLEEALAAKLESVETKRDGKPGEQTARALSGVIGLALLAKEFTTALVVADRAHVLFPDDTGIESNRAHALMFLGYDEEAKALYLAHKKKHVSGEINKLWEQVIADDFAAFRKAGLTNPMMADVEKELGISPDGNSDIGKR